MLSCLLFYTKFNRCKGVRGKCACYYLNASLPEKKYYYNRSVCAVVEYRIVLRMNFERLDFIFNPETFPQRLNHLGCLFFMSTSV